MLSERPSDNGGVFSGTFIVKNSCLCTALLSIGCFDCRETARFSQSIHFSIIQILFLLIICIDFRQQILVPQVFFD